MLTLKTVFVLTNQQVGWIAGAGLWGFAVSQLLFAPLCDTLGMRTLLRMAFAAHVGGVVLMMTAAGFWSLLAGALIIAMGNGLVEAACNPLVATLYPDDRTVRLNRFHVWFPGGIVLGGLAAFGLDRLGLGLWQLKLGLILIPTLLYGALLLAEPFPDTEGVQSGVSMGEMFRATFTSPFLYFMLTAMAMTASLELGPNRWVPAVLEAGGIPGILVLVWISGLMAVLRYSAGPVVHRLRPTGLLLGGAILAGVGLMWLSFAETAAMAFASATLFAAGVCYFWPTMLGVVSERIPRSGALGLGLMGTVGMAVVGIVTSPAMGRIADRYAHDRLTPDLVVPVLESAVATLPDLVASAPGATGQDLAMAAGAARDVLRHFNVEGVLPAPATANALRAVSATDADPSLAWRAAAVLGPADNYGGRVSFRYLTPLAAVLVVVFGVLYARDTAAGPIPEPAARE